jgi:hypothetical protein
MKYTIGGVVNVEKFGVALPPDADLALNAFLDSLFYKIAECPNLNAASCLLDQLGRFQTELAKACFAWDVPLSPRLRTLVREFDRSDDQDLRIQVFNLIKKRQFCSG